MLNPANVLRLSPGDQVIIIAPDDRLPALDALFAPGPPKHMLGRVAAVLGEFTFEGTADIAELIVQAVEERRITRAGIELDPLAAMPFSRDSMRIWLRHLLRRAKPMRPFRKK